MEGWFQKQSENVNDVLRTTQTCKLSLTLLVLSLFHGSLITNLFVSENPHFPGIAILCIERIGRLEKCISGKLFGLLAVILLVEVHEGLLGSRNDLDLGDFTTIASRLEIDLEFFISRSNGEVLHEEAEEHDRLFVLEIVHAQFLKPF